MATDNNIEPSSSDHFISNLSRSIQALCHGCLDFDSDVAIVGYLNIIIDDGQKIDCVLSEKVKQVTNNSISVISDSFLAKRQSLFVKDNADKSTGCSLTDNPKSCNASVGICRRYRLVVNKLFNPLASTSKNGCMLTKKDQF